MSSPDDEIDFELLPYIRFYKSGRFEHLSDDPICDPSPSDPITGVASKDIDIDPAVPISARLFLPPTPSPSLKLPLLVYFHGGSFCYDSAFSILYHSYLNSIAARAGVVIVSVNYRLAPENPLPAAYDDCWAALRWTTASSDPWIAEHADLNRVFIAGDSSGGNIAQRMAVRGGAEGGVRIQGIALFNPYFSTGASEEWALVVKLWRAVCPGTVGGAADPRLYPAADKEAVKGMAGKRLVVFVAEEDGLRKADRAYYEAVRESGWGGVAELVETEGEGHVFHLKKPESRKAKELLEIFASFMNAE